jgi:hypothetical protein
VNLIQSIGAKKVTVIFTVYLMANITYLLNIDGVYWDDWVAYNQEYSTLIRFYGEIMNTTHGYFSIVLSEVGNGIYGFRLALFAMYFISGLMIIYILKNMRLFSSNAAYAVGFLYVMLPIFHTKAALSIIPFYFPVFLFFVAWYWLSRTIDNLDWNHKVGILFLFFVSFTTNSLLVFYALVLLYIFYKQFLESGVDGTLIHKIRKFIGDNIEFILLPLLFFAFKLIYLKPNGEYASYNQLGVEVAKIVEAKDAFYLLMKVISSLLSPLQHVERSLAFAWQFGLIIAVITCIFLLVTKYGDKCQVKLTSYLSLLIIFTIGVVGVVLALFPYLAVGKLPTSMGWESRFQILAILPTSLILYSLVVLGLRLVSVLLGNLIDDRHRNVLAVGVFSFFIAVFLARGLYDQHRLNVDWFYQAGIQQQFVESPVITENKTFVVDNKVRASLAYSRQLMYYEWTGLLKQAFGDDSRLMIPPFYLSRLSGMGTNQNYKQYNFSTWKMTPPILVTIDYNQKMNRKMIAKLYLYRLFDYDKFVELAKGLVSLSYKEI